MGALVVCEFNETPVEPWRVELVKVGAYPTAATGGLIDLSWVADGSAKAVFFWSRDDAHHAARLVVDGMLAAADAIANMGPPT